MILIPNEIAIITMLYIRNCLLSIFWMVLYDQTTLLTYMSQVISVQQILRVVSADSKVRYKALPSKSTMEVNFIFTNDIRHEFAHIVVIAQIY